MSRGSIFERVLVTQREFGRLCENVRQDYRLAQQPGRHFTRTWFDTFDWLLFRHGYALEFDSTAPPQARLRRLEGKADFLMEPLSAVPRFARDFPEGPLRQRLQEAAGVRALLPLGVMGMRAAPYQATDASGKIVFVLNREQYIREDSEGHDRTLLSVARLVALRGYEKAGQHMLLDADRPGRAAPGSPPFERCLRLLGRSPGDYSTRLRVSLDPQAPAGVATARILLFLLETMERNRAGIESDLDIEFLHDFRIAARRSRSLINKVYGVFAAPQFLRFKDEFAWLSETTSGRRDLDVFLLDLRAHRVAIGPDLGPQLDPLRELLESERRTEHDRLLAALQSQRFLRFLADWGDVLRNAAEGADLGTGTSREPVIRVAGYSVRRVWRRLLKRGQQAGEGSYSEALHDMRKICKQLRYLFEAFRTLYSGAEIEALIAQLRRLQNVLGDIVDNHVQRGYLLSWNQRLAVATDSARSLPPAISRLAADFDARESAAVAHFRGRLRGFTGKRNSARIEKLFGVKR